MTRARFPKLRSFFFFAAAVACAWVIQKWAFREEIVEIDGKAVRVIDGDSFKAGEEEFRIYGIDAPEYRQTCSDEQLQLWNCGKVARNGLEAILRKEKYFCAVHARDQFGRTVVKCTSDRGADLGAQLTQRGLAASGQHFDEVIYPVEERMAQNAKRGVWRGDFLRPDIWRQQNPRK